MYKLPANESSRTGLRSVSVSVSHIGGEDGAFSFFLLSFFSFFFFYQKQMSPDRFFLTHSANSSERKIGFIPSRHREGVLKINIRYDEEK